MRGRVGADLHYDKPRLLINANYVLTAQYWGKSHRQNHISHRLNLSSRLTVVPEMLFLNTNAFASPAELTRGGGLSASGEPIDRFNSRDVYGYSVSPEFLLRFQDYATSSLTASHGGVFFVRPATDNSGTPPPITPAQNAFSTMATEQLSSGTYFDRVQWKLIGSYSQSTQTVRTQTQEEGLANLTYALTHAVRVFVTGGYSNYKSSVTLAKDLSGPTALGGITYTLGPDVVFTAEAGTQHNFPTYMGSARWSITPLTMFIAEATDEITTPQGDILSRLGGGVGGGDLGGGLGLGSYGGSSPFGPGGLPLDNSINRVRRVEATLTHTLDQLHLSVSAFGTERDRLDVPVNSPVLPRTSVYGLRASASRALNSHMTAVISTSYSRGNEFGGRDNIISADASVTYHLSDTIDLYLSDHFVHRDSRNLAGFTNAPLTEDQVIVGIRARI
jgi:predicted porin